MTPPADGPGQVRPTPPSTAAATTSTAAVANRVGYTIRFGS